MFDAIVKAVKLSRKKLTIEKHVLNYQSFDDILSKNPRVLIIMCHGMQKKTKKVADSYYFCFEN